MWQIAWWYLGTEILNVKKFLYVSRRAPYGSSYAQESVDVVLIGAAFDQDISLLFIDDGVFQLKEGQDTADIGLKNFSHVYRALDMYDVEKLYVSSKSLAARGLTQKDLVVKVEVLSDAKIQDLLDEHDVIFSF